MGSKSPVSSRLSRPDRSYPLSSWSFLAKPRGSNRCKRRLHAAKVLWKSKSNSKHHELKSEMIETDAEKSAYLYHCYIWGVTVLVFLLLCAEDPRTQNMWTMNTFFVFEQRRNCQTACCGDLRIFCSFRTIFQMLFRSNCHSYHLQRLDVDWGPTDLCFGWMHQLWRRWASGLLGGRPGPTWLKIGHLFVSWLIPLKRMNEGTSCFKLLPYVWSCTGWEDFWIFDLTQVVDKRPRSTLVSTLGLAATPRNKKLLRRTGGRVFCVSVKVNPGIGVE